MSEHQFQLQHCPVCRDATPQPFMKVSLHSYWKCAYCEARFLEPKNRLSHEEEIRHYQTHENDAEDLGYRVFLSKILRPLLTKIEGLSEGLDYGSGPSSALAKMLVEQGFTMSLYDPFFKPDLKVFDQTFDFITCTETAEHFYNPAQEFDRLNSLLRPGGWLGVMTTFQTDDERFEHWRYRRDPTHVVFYRPQTFEIIADQRGWSCEIPCKDVALMQKPCST